MKQILLKKIIRTSTSHQTDTHSRAEEHQSVPEENKDAISHQIDTHSQDEENQTLGKYILRILVFHLPSVAHIHFHIQNT